MADDYELIVVTCTADKNSVLAPHTAEDLWLDYIHFRDEATKFSADESCLLQKRFLRAALVMFVSHCAATVDRWCRAELAREGKSEVEQQEWLRYRCLEKRCAYLYGRARRVKVRRPDFSFKVLRNQVVHAHAGDDLEVFERLTPSLLSGAESEMVKWFDAIGTALGYKRLPDQTVLEDFVHALEGLDAQQQNEMPLKYAERRTL
jgi:hypothetical protein